MSEPVGPGTVVLRKALHMNCLKLKAATLAIQTFLNGQHNLQVHIQLDNISAVAYVHKPQRGDSLPAADEADQHPWGVVSGLSDWISHPSPGVCNIQADHLSQHLTDRCDWKLNPIVFQSIMHMWGWTGLHCDC